MRILTIISWALLVLNLSCCSALTVVDDNPPQDRVKLTGSSAQSRRSHDWKSGRDLNAMSPKVATVFERHLVIDPASIEIRILLIEYYYHPDSITYPVDKKRISHVLWMIENQPRHPILDSFLGTINHTLNFKEYITAKDLWLHHAQHHPKDPVILGHFGMFLSQYRDGDLAIEMLDRAVVLKPSSRSWLKRLGDIYSVRSIEGKHPRRAFHAKEALSRYEAVWKLTEDQLDRFSLSMKIAKVAFANGLIQKGAKYAVEMQKLLPSVVEGKGNHPFGSDVHTIIGMRELHAGNIAKAKVHLVSVRDKAWMGIPCMLLADALVKRGEQDAVIAFLDGLKKRGQLPFVEDWIKELKEGIHPQFGTYLIR